MLFKLSFRNVKRSFRDYAIYFTTLILAVSIFYIFNNLSSQESISSAFELMPMEHLSNIERIIGGLSIFISIILGFLIVYANNFILKRRQKELGIYLTLGMGRGDVMKLLFGETLAIGVLSLIAGIGIGIPLSHVFSVFIFDTLGLYVSQISFIFSWGVVLRTVLNFGIMFMVVILLNILNVRRFKIIYLLNGQNKKPLKGAPGWVALISFPLAIALIGYAYGQVLPQGAFWDIFADNWVPFTTIMGAGFLGTFLLFLSLAGAFVFLASRNKDFYFKNLNAFTTRQITRRLNLNWISLAVICLMMTISISALAAGRTIDTFYQQNTNPASLPFDVTLTVFPQSEAFPELDLSSLTDEVFLLRPMWMSSLNQAGFSIDSIRETNLAQTHGSAAFPGYFLEDVNPILKAQGISPIDLAPDEVALLIHSETLSIADIPLDSFVFEGMTYRLVPVEFTEPNAGLETTLFGSLQHETVLVFHEGTFPEDEASTWHFSLSFNYRGGVLDYEPLLAGYLSDISTAFHLAGHDFSWSYATRNLIIQDGNVNSILLTFISFYVGIIFILVSLSVLSLQQLIDVVESQHRYVILEKMGAEKAMVKRALLTQVGIYSLIPLLVGSLHSAVALRFLYSTLAHQSTRGFSDQLVIVNSFLIVLGIYLIYFAITYGQSKKVLKAA